MSDSIPIEKIPPRTKENFYETFKDTLNLTPSNLDDKYHFYLNHPWNKKHTFKKETK